jgi:Xaa-Pro aminopeptidase
MTGDTFTRRLSVFVLGALALGAALGGCRPDSSDRNPQDDARARAVSSADDPSIPRPLPVGPLAMAPADAAAGEVRGLVGPAPEATLGADVYRNRRRRLAGKLAPKDKDEKLSAALVAGDMTFDGLREGMDVYYLSGVDEPGAAVLLNPANPAADRRESLFLARFEAEEQRWTGDRAMLPSRALEVASGFKVIARSRWLDRALVHACGNTGSLAFVQDFVAEPAPKPKVQELYAKALDRTYGCAVRDLHGTIAWMREVKEPEEIALLRKAIDYTAAGHKAALGGTRPGRREFEVKDIIEDAFHRAGSRHVAYDSIVGSGANGAVLHYPRDNRVMQDGELLLIDAAAEAEYYAADVTRTFPVNGKFTKEQRELYDIVLRAQAAGIAAAKAGALVRDIDDATRKVIGDAGYYDYYPHGCCHFVGLEVHDPGDYDKPLPVGAVLTVEPGIYLPQRALGIRIEDEVLITDKGAEVLTAAIPKDPDEIERLMAAARR